MAAAPVGMKRFYTILGAVAVIGIGLLGYQLAKPATVSIPANVTVQPSDTAGFRGYVKGSADAPVEITEYADYQCPFCQTFATLQMPTIEERLIKTGRLRWRYRDFPLQQHPFSRLAAHSAACADEQGKFWPQHEQIYEGQSEWAVVRDASRHLPPLRRRGRARSGQVRRLHVGREVRRADPGQLRRRHARGRELDAHPARRRPALSGPLRFGRHHPTGRLARAPHQRQMIYRMGAALMSLLGLFVSAYLYLYKIGRIGTLACGSGGCETVQTSQWSRFAGVEVALIGVIGYAAPARAWRWSRCRRRRPSAAGPWICSPLWPRAACSSPPI